MEKRHHERYEEEPAPPYEERTSVPDLEEKHVQKSWSVPQERAAEVRQQRVQLLIDGHVAPLIEDAILNGKHNQTILVVPADTITTNVVLTASNLVHRPKSSSTNVIQLQWPNSTEAFWTHPRTVESLEGGIRRTLRGMTETSQATETLPPRPAELASPVTGQKSWLKRTFGMPGPDHDPTGSTGKWKLGWRSDEANGRMVKVKEVSFRTETEMGLLSTTTAKCVVIDVEFDT
jgi:hypothetical protein